MSTYVGTYYIWTPWETSLKHILLNLLRRHVNFPLLLFKLGWCFAFYVASFKPFNIGNSPEKKSFLLFTQFRVGHFKITKVFIFWRCTRFSHIIWSICCPSVPFLAKSINIWSAASALKFCVLVHTLTLAGMVDYTLGWSCLYLRLFENAQSHHPLWCSFWHSSR